VWAVVIEAKHLGMQNENSKNQNSVTPPHPLQENFEKDQQEKNLFQLFSQSCLIN